MSDVEIHGLMDDGHKGGWEYPASRDWEDIDCKNKACVYKDKSIDKCLSPSLAKIGEDGRCTGFKTDVIEKTRQINNPIIDLEV